MEGELVEGEVVMLMIHESSSCRSFWWQIFMLVYFLGCFFFISWANNLVLCCWTRTVSAYCHLKIIKIRMKFKINVRNAYSDIHLLVDALRLLQGKH